MLPRELICIILRFADIKNETKRKVINACQIDYYEIVVNTLSVDNICFGPNVKNYHHVEIIEFNCKIFRHASKEVCEKALQDGLISSLRE